MLDLFDTLTPEQRAEFEREASDLIAAAMGMGIRLEMSDLKKLADLRFQKQLKEAIENDKH